MSPATVCGFESNPLIKRRVTALSILLTVVMVLAFSIPQAAQATTYRYWNFWVEQDNNWQFATVGAASTKPTDGETQAWRFSASAPGVASIPPADAPRVIFDVTCGETPVIVGKKRVAILVDSGDAILAPSGETPPALTAHCAIGDPDATGMELLNSVTQTRNDNGLICAIDGFPARECTAPVDDSLAAAITSAPSLTDSIVSVSSKDQDLAVGSESDSPTEGSGALAPVGTALVLGILAVIGFAYWRRSRSSR